VTLSIELKLSSADDIGAIAAGQWQHTPSSAPILAGPGLVLLNQVNRRKIAAASDQTFPLYLRFEFRNTIVLSWR
jgi:hypothetical protein